jgi:hypothetical protein
MVQGLGLKAAFAKAIADGAELAPGEKGGATYKGQVFRQKPAHWFRLRDALNRADGKVRFPASYTNV